MEEKQVVIIWSTIKATGTTFVLFAALQAIFTIANWKPLPTDLTSIAIVLTSVLGSWFYGKELLKKGFLRTPKEFLYIFGFSTDENLEALFKSWGKSGGITAFILINLATFILASFALAVAFIGGFAFMYMARKENHPIKWFIIGYSCGIGALLCGILIAALISMLGALIVWSFIITDAIISCVYNYLDLKEWERDQNLKIEQAKASAGLV